MNKKFLIVQITKLAFSNWNDQTDNSLITKSCFQVIEKGILDYWLAVTKSYELKEKNRGCDYIVQEYYEPIPKEIIGIRTVTPYSKDEKIVSNKAYYHSNWKNEKDNLEIDLDNYVFAESLENSEESSVSIKGIFRLKHLNNEN